MPKGYQVQSDGKDLTFIPGKGGSLTYQANVKANPRFYTPKKRAKVVNPQTEMNRRQIALTLANRG